MSTARRIWWHVWGAAGLLFVLAGYPSVSSAQEGQVEPGSLPKGYEQLFRQAEAHLARGRYQDAIQAFKQCVELVRDDPKLLAAVYDNLAMAYHVSGDMDAAIEYFRKATEVENPHPVYSVHLATAYNDREDSGSAVEAALSALRINAAPSFSEPSIVIFAHKQLRRAYRALGRKYGYDWDLLLRDVYSTDKLLNGDPRFVREAKPSPSEIKGLLDVADQLAAAFRHATQARVHPARGVDALLGLSPDDMRRALGEIPIELPDDGVAEQEKEEVLKRWRRME